MVDKLNAKDNQVFLDYMAGGQDSQIAREREVNASSGGALNVAARNLAGLSESAIENADKEAFQLAQDAREYVVQLGNARSAYMQLMNTRLEMEAKLHRQSLEFQRELDVQKSLENKRDLEHAQALYFQQELNKQQDASHEQAILNIRLNHEKALLDLKASHEESMLSKQQKRLEVEKQLSSVLKRSAATKEQQPKLRRSKRRRVTRGLY